MPNRFLSCCAILGVLCALAGDLFGAEEYKPHPDSLPQDGVPKGTVTKHVFASSKIFPGTTRDYSVYVPAQYKKEEPACVMIFQDGGGGLKAPVVFDNLIAKKDMPVTIAIMIAPGVIPAPKDAQAHPRYNRSYEYDSPTDLYARGLQIFDQAGRVTGIIPGPIAGKRPSNVDFGGPGNEYLYIAQGDKIFRRKTKAKGVLFFQGPVLPPKPQL